MASSGICMQHQVYVSTYLSFEGSQSGVGADIKIV